MEVLIHLEIIKSGTALKDTSDIVVCPQAALILDDPHSLGIAYGIFHLHPKRRDLPVELFFFHGKIPSLCFFYWQHSGHPVRPETSVTSILVKFALIWKRVHGIGNFLVMSLPANSLVHKKDKAIVRIDDCVLEGMLLFLPVIILLLSIRIIRTGDLTLGPVMDQNGCFSFHYLPVYYKNETIQTAGHPFYVNPDGKNHILSTENPDILVQFRSISPENNISWDWRMVNAVFESSDNAFDGDISTFYDAIEGISWKGLDFGENKTIASIRYSPRTHGIEIYEGHEYEMFYWADKTWKSLGKKLETGQVIESNAPTNALLYVYNRTLKKMGQPFFMLGDRISYNN